MTTNKQTINTKKIIAIKKKLSTEKENTIEHIPDKTIPHECNVNGCILKEISAMVDANEMVVFKILKKHTHSANKTLISHGRIKTINEDTYNFILHKYVVNGLSLEEIDVMVGAIKLIVISILNTFRKNRPIGPIDFIKSRARITEEDKLELTH